MLGKDIKRQHPKQKKKPNLKIIDTNQQNLFQKLTNKIKSVKNKNDPKSIIKTKKIDNKNILNQLKSHLDDFPVVLKCDKLNPDKMVNNTTLNLNKQNKEYLQYHINRPSSSIPFRESKRPKKQEERKKKSSSICNDINDPLEKNQINTTKNIKKFLKLNNNILQLDDDKQNRYSVSRNSFALERNSFGGQKRFRLNNKSCNDEQLRSRYYKSKTPVSKSTRRMKYPVNQLQKKNFSCLQIIDIKNTCSLQKDGKKIKKKKQINNEKQKRRYSVNLINPQKIASSRNDKSKEMQKIDLKKLKKTKKSISQTEKLLKKKKQSQHNVIINLDNLNSHRPRKSLNSQQNIKYIQNLKKKKSLIEKQVSQEEQSQYPPPKFINIKKKKSKQEKPFNNMIYKKILSNGSLIKSSLETSKKLSHQRTVQYQRITELQQQGTSIKKLHCKILEPEGFSLELNINEIRQYQRLSFVKKFKKQKYRKQLYVRIHQQYPQLNQQEIIFLASVIFIQRKWREYSAKSNPNFIIQNKEIKNQKQIHQIQYQIDEKEIKKNEFMDFKQYQSNINKLLNNPTQNKEFLKDPQFKNLIQKKRKQLTNSVVVSIQSQHKYKQYFDQLQNKNIKSISGNSEINKINKQNILQEPMKEQLKFNVIRNFKKKIEQEEQIQIINIRQPFSKKSSESISKQNIKIKTQITENSDSFNLQKQLFPDQLINIRKGCLLNNFETNLQRLEEMYINSNINSNRFQNQKYSLQKQLENSVVQLKQSKKDIEKGYLKYIDCIKNIKFQTRKPKKKLRKVSSQNGLMAKLYLKFFKVQSSNDSDSLKKLKRKLLIRKEYFQNGQDQMLLSLGDQHTDRVLRRDFHKFTPLIDRQDNSHLNFEQWQNIKNKGEIKQAVMNFIGQIDKKEKAQSMNSFLVNLHTSSEQQQEINLIEQNKKKQQCCVELSQEIFFVLIQEFQRQVSQSQVLQKRIHLKQEKKKRNLPGLSSIKYKITHYVNSFFNYIIKNYLDQILNNFNTVVGFSPISYLKIIRDHQYSEPQEYVPMISNKIYIQYEPIYFSEIQLDKQLVKFQNFLRAIISINNKALFQAIVVELQKLRPYGEQGVPYPWDKQPIYKRGNISKEQFLNICEIVKSNIVQFDKKKCGIILEKYLIRNSNELQKLHEQKQDCLIDTVQEQVKKQQQARYQLNEQILEIKLNIAHWLIEAILGECTQQIYKIISKNQF